MTQFLKKKWLKPLKKLVLSMVFNMTQYFFNRKYKALPHSIEGNKNREKCLKALINKENFKKSWFRKNKNKIKKKAKSL